MEERAGNLLTGYELEVRIGDGQFSAVHRAMQRSTGREVAVKVIAPDRVSRPEFIHRFEADAARVAHLEHPHITPLYDFWRDPTGAYLVMRYLRGGSVQAALKHGPYDLNTASLILDQIASALDFAHRHGAVHGSIKPSNVLLDEDGNSYLTDFRIARAPASANGRGNFGNDRAGALTYSAPETISGVDETHQADQYSLGVTLCEMITGAHLDQRSVSDVTIFQGVRP